MVLWQGFCCYLQQIFWGNSHDLLSGVATIFKHRYSIGTFEAVPGGGCPKLCTHSADTQLEGWHSVEDPV